MFKLERVARQYQWWSVLGINTVSSFAYSVRNGTSVLFSRKHLLEYL